ncbi:hypothetical protein DUNSADRAFT_13682 [Dunaliella salina]|nr:hypothetical protein DUNSADRAFT_13682 [Dunaliella salina]|eukprot:KAF5831032.1 hypothetical protein DUNSADRAFT_13682 [Dunaliella salina]
MFESIHSNLERELAKVKKDMAETIQQANQIFEAKEKAIAEMGQLMAQAEKEQAGFEDEWRQLTQIIEDDKRERDRLRAKELEERERETDELLKSGVGKGGTSKRASTATRRGTLGSPAANKALAQNVAAEKVQMYGQAFEKIQQATGIEEIDQLVNSFISAEGQNYTLFNYVNEVNNEIEKLEDQTQVIKVEIERYKDSGQELDRSKGSAMRDVEDRLAAAESQADLYEKRFEAASETVAMLKSSIWELFNKIGCNTQAVRELLGEEGQVSEGNVLAHLGIIEQRTNEILQAYLVHRSKDKSKAAAHWPSHSVIAQALLAQPLTSASPRIIIDPPNRASPEPHPDATNMPYKTTDPKKQLPPLRRVAHRMLLLDTKQIAPVGAPDGACQEFTVLGATGNVHMCRVGRYHSCSCEDNESNRHKFPCKHILFCYVRFLIPMSDEEEKGLYDLRSQAILDSDSATGDGTQGDSMPCNSDGGGDGSEGDEAEEEKEDEEENGPKKPSGSGMDRLTQKFFPIWQRVLTISEANAVLRGLSDGRGVIDQSALANARLRRRYAQLKGTPLEFCPPEGPATGVGEVKQRPVEGDCPICAFEMSSAEEVVWCAVCGHNCHKVCMEAWAAAKRGRHGQAQCIFCRSLWQPGCDAEPSPDQANTAGHNNTSIGPHNLDPHREQPSIHELYPNVPRYVLDHIVQHRNPA